MHIIDELARVDLELLSFNAIRNQDEKKEALEILTNCVDMRPMCFKMICERTKERIAYVEKTCRQGLELTLHLQKHSGSIVIYIRKKRNCIMSILFMDRCLNVIQTWSDTYQSKIKNWKRVLIYEFGESILKYIVSGLSNKNKELKKLIKNNICTSNFHANIDSGNFKCIF